MISCLYCSQTIKNSSHQSMHDNCKTIYYSKCKTSVIRPLNGHYPEISLAGGRKVKVCKECFNQVSNQQTTEVETFIIKEKLPFKAKGICLLCARKYLGSDTTKEDKERFLRSRDGYKREILK